MSMRDDVLRHCWEYDCEFPAKGEHIPTGKHVGVIERPKPPTHYYHYSNQSSQGSLMTQTSGFPGWFDKRTHDYSAAYEDRLWGWNRDRMEKACEAMGGGMMNCQRATAEQLKSFAKIALNLPVEPEHVRIVHYFNAATGYPCPVVEAVYRSQADQDQVRNET